VRGSPAARHPILLALQFPSSSILLWASNTPEFFGTPGVRLAKTRRGRKALPVGIMNWDFLPWKSCAICTFIKSPPPAGMTPITWGARRKEAAPPDWPPVHELLSSSLPCQPVRLSLHALRTAPPTTCPSNGEPPNPKLPCRKLTESTSRYESSQQTWPGGKSVSHVRLLL
jgi:hypothetical protein